MVWVALYLLCGCITWIVWWVRTRSAFKDDAFINSVLLVLFWILLIDRTIISIYRMARGR